MDRAARRRAERAGLTTDPATVLWCSNATWAPTGYGSQTKQVVKRMIADGHHVAVAANYGLEAAPLVHEGVPHLPRGYELYGNDVIPAYFKAYSNEFPTERKAIVTLYDAWVYDAQRLGELPIYSWVPIDMLPAPRAVAKWCARDNVTPLAMSKYGHGALAAAGIESILIPHGIDTTTFRPVAGSRHLLGFEPDRFVVGIVNANKGLPSRKAFAEQFMAFAMFARTHPDAALYVHTEQTAALGGIDFPALVEMTGLIPEQYRFVNQFNYRMGIPDEALAGIYSGMDVLLAATYGEGFGLTVAEAQACGTPVIVQDFTAQPELVGDGWTVQGQPFYNADQASWQSIPSIPQMVDRLHEAYERKGSGPSMTARAHIVENYDADAIYAHCWRPLLESM